MFILIAVVFLSGIGFAIYGLLPSPSIRPGQKKTPKTASDAKLSLNSVSNTQGKEEQQIQPLPLELEKLRSDYANLEAEANVLRKKESAFQSELLKRNEWVKNSDEALKKTKEKSDEFEKKFINKEHELQIEFAKNVDLSRELREEKTNHDRLENENKGLSAENERMKHQIKKLTDEQKTDRQTIAEFKRQQETSQWVAKQDFIKLNEEYTQLEKELEHQENKAKDLMTEVARLMGQLKDKNLSG